MSIRVYSLASELSIPSKKLLELCVLEGIDAHSHAATLTESEAGRVRARYEAEQAASGAPSAEAAAPKAGPSAGPAIPPPLPPRVDPSKLAFAPTLGRRRPPQRGVVVPGAEEAEEKAAAAAEETKPAAAEVAAPAEVAEKTAEAVVAEAPAEAAEEAAAETTVEAPSAAEAPSAERAEAAEEAEAPVAEAGEEEVPEASSTEPAGGESAPKSVSVDEFKIDIPKPLGRIEGIVPKKIPTRERKKGKEAAASAAASAEEKPAKAHPQAHPQAVGKPRTRPGLSEAGKKAREVAERQIKQAHRQTPSQRGLMADTNRPQSGRSASAGGRRAAPRSAEEAPRSEEEEVESVEVEEKRLNKPVKKPTKGGRRDKVEVDSDIEILGSSHVRLERGEAIRRPFGERRRRTRGGERKRADQPAVKGGAVEIEEPITVKSFCAALGVQASAVIGRLMRQGIMVTVNEVLTNEKAEELALEFGIELKVVQAVDVEDAIKHRVEELDEAEASDAVSRPRAPVVTFLGHVDHGKTSLMDKIRRTNVVDGESGGITQHIGAYRVKVGDGAVTFLDTPGHEAFTAMRARGARVTDIVVLVVAADDGIMPQTEEAINHARAAGVPIVVALNKCDKAEANIQRVLGQLAERDLIPEEWGGKTIVVQTSAITGDGIDQLLESLLLESELLELHADPNRNARGAVIEAEMTEGLGATMTLLVQDGTLHVGDVLLAGTATGRVRAMEDDKRQPVEEAGPSMPVRVSGLSAVPNAGDEFYVFDSLQAAREFAEQRERKIRESALSTRKHVTLEKLFEQMEAREVKELNVIVKADVQGSVEVLRQSIGELKHPEVQVTVLHAAVGPINESDVLLADASDAVVIGFHVIADDRARALAEQKGVDIRLYSVIYQITDDLRNALEGMLSPETRQQVVGHVVVRQTFKVSRLGTVAGCYVQDGVIRRNNVVRVSRQGVVVYEGKLDSLKRFKDDAREVSTGLECGLKIAGFDDVKMDDVIESIETVEIKRKL